MGILHPPLEDLEFRKIYRNLLEHGQLCSPRGQKVIEIENFAVDLPPYARFTNFASRKLNLNYIKREFLWYLGGSLTDLSIGQHAKLWNSLVVDGKLNSNYGHYIFQQGGIDWAVEELIRDKDSRRAAIPILDHTHLSAGTKDFPCTYAVAFRIRGAQLNMTVRMRSLDLVYGFSNDIPNFSFIHEMMLKLLQRVYPLLTLGTYHHSADSAHVYERHFEMLKKLPNDQFTPIDCPRMYSHEEAAFLRLVGDSLAHGIEKSDIQVTNPHYRFTQWLLEENTAW